MFEQNIDSPYFQEQLLQNVDKETILLIYSTKEQEFRGMPILKKNFSPLSDTHIFDMLFFGKEVKLIPNSNWSSNSQDGLIGKSSFCKLYIYTHFF